MGFKIENKLYRLVKEMSSDLGYSEVFILDVIIRYLRDIFHAIEHGEKVVIPRIVVIYVNKKDELPSKETSFKTRCRLVAESLNVNYKDVEIVLREYHNKLLASEGVIHIPCVCDIKLKNKDGKVTTYTSINPFLKSVLEYKYGKGKYKLNTKASEVVKVGV